jgi:hypothetical protein
MLPGFTTVSIICLLMGQYMYHQAAHITSLHQLGDHVEAALQ